MKDPLDVVVTLRVSRPMYEALKAVSDKEERTLAAVIRRALRAQLSNTLEDTAARSES